jgi:hypothetical protein
MDSVHPSPCPGCRRPRFECWIAPCLDFEMIKAKGVKAEAWVRLGFPKHLRDNIHVEEKL